MRLLMENYERWLPHRFKITYQPLGDATLSGGIVMVPLMDPDVQLSIGDAGAAKVSRAMDYAGSVNFNIYNHAVCEFPTLPENEEPYYINSGHSARFEFPFAFQVMAQTVFPPGVALETTRDIGWLKIHYEIKLYDPRLPEFSVENIISIQTWFGADIAQIFDNGSLGLDESVIGLIAPGFWSLTAADTDKVGIMRILSDVLDIGGSLLIMRSPTHPDVPIVKGTILFAKVVADTPGVGGIPTIRLYTNLDNLFDETGGMTWGVSPADGILAGGIIEFSLYDLDHVL